MKKILALFAVLTASFCLSIPAFAATPDANLDINKFVIQWQDEFDGTALNESYWITVSGNGETTKKNIIKKTISACLTEL